MTNKRCKSRRAQLLDQVSDLPDAEQRALVRSLEIMFRSRDEQAERRRRQAERKQRRPRLRAVTAEEFLREYA